VAQRNEQEKKGSGLVILGLGGAAVAVLVAYLADCVPGFGLRGSGDAAEGSAKQDPPQPKPPEPEGNKAAGVAYVVEGDRCRRDAGTSEDCEATCRALEPAASPPPHVTIDVTFGTHRSVERLRRCLREAGYINVKLDRR
jgi:hypothetical protein